MLKNMNWLWVLLILPLIFGQSCVDKHEFCKFWSGRNECNKNPIWMKPNCPVSCGLCSPMTNPTTIQIPRSNLPLTVPGNAFDRPIATRPDCSVEVQTRVTPSKNEYEDGIRNENCGRVIQPNICDRNPCFHSRYRTFDGSCNNLIDSIKGASFTPFVRLLEARYVDGRDEMFGFNPATAINPRLITTFLLSSKVTIPSKANGMLMQWGQFLSHDITHNTFLAACGNNVCRRTKTCAPIFYPNRDPKRSEVCSTFSRSVPMCRDRDEARNQMNENTAFIDGSMIYGSDFKTQRNIRRGALMNTDRIRGSVFPPRSDSVMHTGDDRSNLFVGLTALHSIFIRFHNKMARQLQKLNPHWSEETIFQETRKILGAYIQVITYKEFLPALLGAQASQLILPYNGYKPEINPGISNEFAAGAYRLHGMIQEFYPVVDENYRIINRIRFVEGTGNVAKLLSFGTDSIIRGLTTVPSRKPQRITKQVTEELFGNFDMSSINIQRGRDHGLRTYNDYRDLCKLPRLTSFENWPEVSDEAVRDRIRELYNNDPDAIDFYVGGIVEEPVGGSQVGPLFSCIIAEQFTRSRDGDRFYFENPQIFTPAQVEMLKRGSLASIICQTGDRLTRISPTAFLVDEDGNDAISCDLIDALDLRVWQEVVTGN